MLEDIPLDDDYSSGEEEGAEEGGEEEGGTVGNQRPGAGGERAGGNREGRRELERERRVVDYNMFLDEIWSKIAKARPEAKELSPANLFQEIHSYYPVPCTPNLIPCTLYPVPCTLNPVPCTLYPAPRTLCSVPCTLNPVP